MLSDFLTLYVSVLYAVGILQVDQVTQSTFTVHTNPTVVLDEMHLVVIGCLEVSIGLAKKL